MKSELDGQALVVEKIAQNGDHLTRLHGGLLALLKCFEYAAIRGCRKESSISRKVVAYL